MISHDNLLPLRLSELLDEHKLSIFLFHGVIAKNRSGVRNYTGKHIEKDLFYKCMIELSKCGTPLSMDNVLTHLEANEPFPRNSFAITFDDGFENNYSIAAPILEDLKIPAIIYITTRFIDENYMSWIDRVEYAVEKTAEKSIQPEWTSTPYSLKNVSEKINFLKEVRKYVKNAPDSDSNKVADLVTDQLGIHVTSSDHPLDQKMNWDQVNELNRSDFFSIGGHSHTHPILSFLNDEALNFEIDHSVDQINEHTGCTPQHYSYPEGLSHCYSEKVIQKLKTRGIRCCPTAIFGHNLPETDPFHLNRILVA